MQDENRNIILLVDNAPTHTLTEGVTFPNIAIHYLPQHIYNHVMQASFIVSKLIIKGYF
jgi:hypothetical protein